MRNRIGIAITVVFICLFSGFMLFNPNTHTELFERTVFRQVEESGIHIITEEGQRFVFANQRGRHIFFRDVVMKSNQVIAGKEYYMIHCRVFVWEGKKRNIRINGIIRYYRDEDDPRKFVLDQWIPLKVLRQKGFW